MWRVGGGGGGPVVLICHDIHHDDSMYFQRKQRRLLLTRLTNSQLMQKRTQFHIPNTSPLPFMSPVPSAPTLTTCSCDQKSQLFINSDSLSFSTTCLLLWPQLHLPNSELVFSSSRMNYCARAFAWSGLGILVLILDKISLSSSHRYFY